MLLMHRAYGMQVVRSKNVLASFRVAVSALAAGQVVVPFTGRQ